MTLRVLHCPDTVGGQAGALAAAERAIGLDSWSVALVDGPFGHLVDEVIGRRGGGPVGRLRFEAARWRLVLRALREVDVVHFNFGRTILPGPPLGPAGPGQRAYAATCSFLDLRLLRRAGKGVVVTFQGDDIRRGDTPAARRPGSLPQALPERYLPQADRAKGTIAAAFDRHAHAIRYLNPDLAWSLPERARFLPYAAVDLAAWTLPARPSGEVGLPGRSSSGARLPVVVHAPSDRAAKGTADVLAAVAQLAAAGTPVDLRLVEGVPRADVRLALEQADIVVDQLRAGWYGALAVEAMALGVPVVCRIDREDSVRVPAGLAAELPVVDATPATLAATLGALLTDAPRRIRLGAEGRAFVERWHDPRAVARELLADYLLAAGRPAQPGSGPEPGATGRT